MVSGQEAAAGSLEGDASTARDRQTAAPLALVSGESIVEHTRAAALGLCKGTDAVRRSVEAGAARWLEAAAKLRRPCGSFVGCPS